MSREFKFRIWDKTLETFINLSQFFLNKGILGDLNGEYIIQQYIGILDVNGLEICEGDIVEVDVRRLGIDKYMVKFESPQYVLEFLPQDLETSLADIPIDYNINSIKIIGNTLEGEKIPFNL